jgi:3-hydroxyisobutyrate dehydrogenase-like beta-hydroxyacid dehydrogenase
VLGTGTAGAAVARRLRVVGHEVAAWNRTPGRAEALREDGVDLSRTPAAAVRSADVVLLVVLDAPAVAEVLEALPDRLDGAPLVADLTTTGAEATREAIERLAAAGARAVKAPFFGSVPEAAAGGLFFTLGCAPEHEDAAREALAPLGQAFRVGDPVTCARVKVALNPLVFVMVGVLAEALGSRARRGSTRHS